MQASRRSGDRRICRRRGFDDRPDVAFVQPLTEPVRDQIGLADDLTVGRRAAEALTAREREIAGHIANGLSNHAFAEQLVITEGTVEVDVKHILGKLGLRSRTQVAMWFTAQRSDMRADKRT